MTHTIVEPKREIPPYELEMRETLRRAKSFIHGVVEGEEWEGCTGREIILDIELVLNIK